MQPATATAADLLSRMESVPFSGWHAKARIVMGSATFFDAFNSLSLAFALPILIRTWHISPQESGLLIGTAYLGQLLGALLFGGLAERFGRIRSATAGVAIMAVMTLACVFACSFPALIACRFVQGIGIGGEMPVAATYISELSRAHGRGKFFLLYEMIFPLGLLGAGQMGAWLVPTFGWQSIFLVGSIPCLVITFLIARLPESPRWLLSKGRLVEAEAVVKQIEASTDRRQPVAPATTPHTVTAGRTKWRELLSGSYRSRTLVVWALWACAFFVANTLNNWLPSLYNTIYHLPLRQSLRAASLTNIAQVAVLLVCAFSIDRIGRRNWTVASFIVGGGLLALLGLTGSGNVVSVIVTKTVPPYIIRQAAGLGLRDLGENRVQEAQVKQSALGLAGALRWHLIGHLQSNKVRRAVELFDVVQSVDSAELVVALDRHAAALGKKLEVFIQVNIAAEPAKHGINPEALPLLADKASKAGHLRLTGLMAIAPYNEDPQASKPHFARMRKLRDSLDARFKLSMGMSNDFETAIEEGADYVRIGTALFGDRNTV